MATDLRREVAMFGVIAAVVAITGVSAVGIYNSLIRKRMDTKNAWSQIDVQLKRRYDLVPNLVDAVKGYAAHESETLDRVVRARNSAVSADGVSQRAQAETSLTSALRGLFALAEAYPDLKANANFLALQEELSATEDRIGFARQHYNDAVGQFNVALQAFPGNLFAKPLHFQEAEFFQLGAEEASAVRRVPEVRFVSPASSHPAPQS
jgi:LemA protein